MIVNKRVLLASGGTLIAIKLAEKSKPYLEQRFGSNNTKLINFLIYSGLAAYLFYGWYIYENRHDGVKVAKATAILTISPIPFPPGIP